MQLDPTPHYCVAIHRSLDLGSMARAKSPLNRHQKSFPSLITAASKASLNENTKVLGLDLERKTAALESRVAEVAFTLSQRRQRQEFYAAIKADSIHDAGFQLKSLSSTDISEFPTTADAVKPIMLVSSG